MGESPDAGSVITAHIPEISHAAPTSGWHIVLNFDTTSMLLVLGYRIE
jgi:hypothetical protein